MENMGHQFYWDQLHCKLSVHTLHWAYIHKHIEIWLAVVVCCQCLARVQSYCAKLLQYSTVQQKDTSGTDADIPERYHYTASATTDWQIRSCIWRQGQLKCTECHPWKLLSIPSFDSSTIDATTSWHKLAGEIFKCKIRKSLSFNVMSPFAWPGFEALSISATSVTKICEEGVTERIMADEKHKQLHWINHADHWNIHQSVSRTVTSCG